MSHPQPHPALLITALKPADIQPATALEAAAYGAARSARDFQRELGHNALAHYMALRVLGASHRLVGLAGYWLIVDEAHIITIAVEPRWQGQGLGEYLLYTLIQHSQRRGAEAVTLEVRPSNQKARAMYQKYGFARVGRRKGYYRDTGEDAFILTTPHLADETYQQLLAQHRAALWPRLAQIEIDETFLPGQ